MKQHTTPEQTARLIELGFEEPKASHRYFEGNTLHINNNYSIGELIEMLPDKIDGRNLVFERYVKLEKWLVCYEVCLGVYSMSAELCDALYEMAVKLREEGVI